MKYFWAFYRPYLQQIKKAEGSLFLKKAFTIYATIPKAIVVSILERFRIKRVLLLSPTVL